MRCHLSQLTAVAAILAALLPSPSWAGMGPFDPLERIEPAPRGTTLESTVALDGWTRPFDAAVNPLDIKWDDRFWVAGIQDAVNDMVEYNGDLIVGGRFTFIDGYPQRFVARWDGLQWHAMGEGLPDQVQKLHVFNGKVYAIGRFNEVMRWDGSSWSVAAAMPPGGLSDLDPYHSIIDYDGSLVVGTYRGVYKLVDGAWQSLGSIYFWQQYSPRINALLVDRGYLYAGGNLVSAAGVPARGVARWNGSVWEALGEGVNGTVYDLAARDGLIIAMGRFDTAGVAPVRNIAAWNGTNWSAYTTGTSDYVNAHYDLGSDFVVAGYFVTAGSDTVHSIARWDGAAWHSYDRSLTYAWISSLVLYNNELIAGGTFVGKGAQRVNHLARWSGSEWTSVAPARHGLGLYGAVSELAVFENTLLIGGSVLGSDERALGNLTSFDGDAWIDYAGVGGTVYVGALSEYNGNLVVGGGFDSIGGVTAKCVALWDGATWTPLAASVLSTPGGAYAVTDMVEFDGKLVVAGWAKGYDGVEAVGVAQWDGMAWSKLGDGLADCGAWSSRVYDLEVYNGDLYIGGHFGSYTACGPGPKYLARWDGTELTQFAELDGSVSQMIVFNGDLIISGYFNHINGLPVSQFARWDGSEWHAFGSGLTTAPDGTPGIEDMIVYNGELIVGGYYYKKYSWGSRAEPILARWDGATWRTLGSGIGAGSYVSSFALWNGQLVVGGWFSEMGGKAANYITIWNGGGPCCALRGDINGTGNIEVADLTFLVNALFRGGPSASCPDHSDLDGSGSTIVSDLTYLVSFLFRGGTTPVPCPAR